MNNSLTLQIRNLGRQDYEPVWQEMKAFTANRDEQTHDELWIVEHPPVFTLGLNGKREHLLNPSDIPVIPVDRGGQVTYHGPGQLVIYTLLDLDRLGIGVQQLVRHIEQSIINLLAGYGIDAHGRRDAPGVYVGDAKIAALGLRIKRNRSYHGLALNIDMELEPFTRINPCGYAGMPVTRLVDLTADVDTSRIPQQLAEQLTNILGYNNVLV